MEMKFILMDFLLMIMFMMVLEILMNTMADSAKLQNFQMEFMLTLPQSIQLQ